MNKKRLIIAIVVLILILVLPLFIGNITPRFVFNWLAGFGIISLILIVVIFISSAFGGLEDLIKWLKDEV